MPVLGLIVVLGAGYLFDIDKWLFGHLRDLKRSVIDNEHVTGVEEIEETAIFTGAEFQATENDIRENALSHAPAVDPLIMDGASRAIKEYVRLFKRQAVAAHVTYSAKPVDENSHAVTLRVSLGLDTFSYQLVYSSTPEDFQRNVDQLRNVLASFQNDFKAQVLTVPEIRINETLSFDSSVVRAQFRSSDWLTSLREIDGNIDRHGFSPQLLYAAAEAYSWLALYKDWHEDDTLSASLAADAVGNYLLAGLFSPRSGSGSRYYEGLLQLALHHERAALSVLDTVPAAHAESAQILMAYIRADTAQLKRLARHNVAAGYFLARAYGTLDQSGDAERALLEVLSRAPDYLEAKHYLVHVASLGKARQVLPRILDDTVRAHARMVGSTLPAQELTPIELLRTIFLGEPSTLENHLRSLSRRHAQTIDSVAATKPDDGLIEGDRLRSYLRQDFLNTCLLAYEVYAEKLAIPENARTIASVVQDIYPHSDLARVFQLRVAVWGGDPEQRLDLARSIDPKSSGVFLLREMLKTYGSWDYWKVWPNVVAALREYHGKEAQGSKGSKRLSFYYYHSLHRDIGIAYLRRAKTLNPYDYVLYKRLAAYEDREQYLDEGAAYVGKSYSFLLARGDWKLRKEDTEAAIQFYRQAIDRSPAAQPAYLRLARAYQSKGRDNAVVAVCQDYLRQDQDTLLAVAIQSLMGNMFLEKEDYQRAYDIFDATKGSNQGSALLGFAKVNERLGYQEVAESYFKRLAERYPTGAGPAEYALFHLRQQDMASAISVLQDYLPNNRADYYFDKLIGFYGNNGQTGKVIDIVDQVHKGSPAPLTLYILADKLSRADFHDAAAGLHWRLVEMGFETWLHAALYVTESTRAGASPDSAISKAYSALGDDMPAQSFFALHFLKEGAYELAFSLYPKVNYQDNWDQAHRALMMTLAWKAGALGEESLQQIDTGPLDQDPWRKLLAAYLRGEQKESAVLADTKDSAQYLTAFFYIGMNRLIDAEPDVAAQYFRTGLSKGSLAPAEYFLAYSQLARLENKTTDWCCRKDLN
ncbi:MAG TPA: tetratricopeptide repeat protein [Gammaproteobacteria bacterium]|nr:tetratricopeptide repeat protein [Gammaproteobacteria bacterium]